MIDIHRNKELSVLLKQNLFNLSQRHLFALSVNRNQVEWLIDRLHEAYDEINRLRLTQQEVQK